MPRVVPWKESNACMLILSLLYMHSTCMYTKILHEVQCHNQDPIDLIFTFPNAILLIHRTPQLAMCLHACKHLTCIGPTIIWGPPIIINSSTIIINHKSALSLDNAIIYHMTLTTWKIATNLASMGSTKWDAYFHNCSLHVIQSSHIGCHLNQ